MKDSKEKEFIIIDDILDKSQSKYLEKVILSQYSFQAKDGFLGTSGIPNESFKKMGENKIYEQFQLVSDCVNKFNFPQTFEKKFYHISTFPLIMACLKMGWVFREEDLFRCKINLQTKAPKKFKGYYNFPHTDLNLNELDQYKDMLTAIYYVTNSDGDTNFFNEPNYNPASHKKSLSEFYNNLTIKNQVSPKPGRIVIFPSYYLHAGMHPIKSNIRVVINYNFRARFISDLINGVKKEFENNLES